MLLRRVANLGPGMVIRLPQSGDEQVSGFPIPDGPRMRVTLCTANPDKESWVRLYPDDLVEMVNEA